ncbi:MAG: hypothetical protein LBQ75_04360 [Zoogloeaceae bacterium]|jgi:hypothetical protein|nr:hypothetical protein [Zoogloeaceae bacterium]
MRAGQSNQSDTCYDDFVPCGKPLNLFVIMIQAIAAKGRKAGNVGKVSGFWRDCLCGVGALAGGENGCQNGGVSENNVS